MEQLQGGERPERRGAVIREDDVGAELLECAGEGLAGLDPLGDDPRPCSIELLLQEFCIGGLVFEEKNPENSLILAAGTPRSILDGDSTFLAYLVYTLLVVAGQCVAELAARQSSGGSRHQAEGRGPRQPRYSIGEQFRDADRRCVSRTRSR